MSPNTTTAQRSPSAKLALLSRMGEQPQRQLTIIIPTFNEADNVEPLLQQLAEALPSELAAEVIFVDDSTDNTPHVIASVRDQYPLSVRLIHRDQPSGGLGGAVVDGLRAARSPWAVVMDGDLQHPPSLVPALLAKGMGTDSDLVVATRYAEGGSNDGLSNAYRRYVSTSAKALAVAVLGRPVGSMSDPLSGFFAVRIDALRLDAVNPIGYKILLELVVHSRFRRIEEVPFVFGARHAGTSKSTMREGLRYLRHLVRLRTHSRNACAIDPAGQDRDGGRVWPARSVGRDHLDGIGGDDSGSGLNVLVVTSEAPPIVSGISRCVDRLTAGLRDRGHRVDVLSSVQIPRLVLGEYRFSALAGYWPSISRRLADYDVINLHGPVPTMSDVFLALGAGRDTPIVYTHHSALAIRGMGMLCAIYNRIHRALSGRADLTLTTSEHYADWERRPGGPEVRVAPWGVDVRPFPLKPRSGASPLQVLFVGQMRGYKGVDWLIRAVAGRHEFELTLVGDGPQRSEYEQLAAQLGAHNVRFLGRVSDEALHAEYDRSDVIVLPSVTQAEAYGLVVLEGMAAGCVPVVSDLPGVRDVVEGVGLVVPPCDEVALRDALQGLASDEHRRKALGRLARRKAESLRWDSCVDQYETALQDAVRTRRGHQFRSPHSAVTPVAMSSRRTSSALPALASRTRETG